jgi:hypothetical protein
MFVSLIFWSAICKKKSHNVICQKIDFPGPGTPWHLRFWPQDQGDLAPLAETFLAIQRFQQPISIVGNLW